MRNTGRDDWRRKLQKLGEADKSIFLAVTTRMASKCYRFTPERRELYLECLRRGLRHGEAARCSGVSRQTVWYYIKSHPEFRERAEVAEWDAADAVEDALWRLAIGGNFQAIRFWLVNRAPERWSRNPAPAVKPAPPPRPQNLAEVQAELLRRLSGEGH